MIRFNQVIYEAIINRFHDNFILKQQWHKFKKYYSNIELDSRDYKNESKALIEKEEIIRKLLRKFESTSFLEIGLGPQPNLDRMRLISQKNIRYSGCDFEDVCKTHQEILTKNNLWGDTIRLFSNRVGTYTWSLFDLMKNDEQFDLIYIDGNHTLYIDLPAFIVSHSMLKPGGCILVDDINFTLTSLIQDMVSNFGTWRYYMPKYDLNQYSAEQQRIPHIRKIVEDLLIPHMGYKTIELSENPYVELRLLQKP